MRLLVATVLPGLRLARPDLARRVTMRHLLIHTSGVDGDIFTDTGRGDECLERYVALLADAPVLHPPGAVFSYCNAGYVLAGRIIEVLTGQSWDQALRERLIAPLGLTMPPPLAPPAVSPGISPEQYTGTYERAATRSEVFARGGKLMLRTTTTGPLAELEEQPVRELTLVPVTENLFVVRPPDRKTWIPVTFFHLPDGTPCLHSGVRAAPKVS